MDQDKRCPEIVEDIDAAWRFCGEITKFIVSALVCFAILAAVASIWGTR